jgi:hypothetical protein
MQARPLRQSITRSTESTHNPIRVFGFFPIFGYVTPTLLPLSADDNLATKGVLIACGTLHHGVQPLLWPIKPCRSDDKTCSGARNPLRVIIEPIVRLSQDILGGAKAGRRRRLKAERKQMVVCDL